MRRLWFQRHATEVLARPCVSSWQLGVLPTSHTLLTRNSFSAPQPFRHFSTNEAIKETVPESTQVVVVKDKNSLGANVWKNLKEKGCQFLQNTVLLEKNVIQSWRLIQKRNILGNDSLTRKDIRLVEQTKRDVSVIAPFTFLLFVLPEILPFLLIFAPASLPSVYKNLVPQERALKRQAANKIKAAHKIDKLCSQHPLLQKEFTSVLGSPSEAKWRSDLDIENLSPSLLRALCTLVSIKTFGRPDAYLRYSLSKKLDYLSADDRLIQQEGIPSLTPDELNEALHERGFLKHTHSKDVRSAPFATEEKLLQNWLHLADHTRCLPKVYPLLYAAHVCKGA